MTERSIGIRELKSKLSACVREVKRGGVIVVTEHGRRVARIIPEAHSLAERLQTLKIAGAILWSGRGLGTRKPDVQARGERSVADIIVGDRE